jgi:DNA-binding MarR family transcriptional regulator
MSVAPETQEPSAESLAAVAGFRLRRLQGLFVAHFAAWFRDVLAVTPVQGGILMLVDENPGLTQIALARLLRIEPPSLTQALNPLVDAGLVERTRAARDGRAVALRLSRAGRQAVAVVRRETPAQELDAFSGLTAEERRTLLALLDKALASTEAALGRRGAQPTIVAGLAAGRGT